jgi:hypothetical protein
MFTRSLASTASHVDERRDFGPNDIRRLENAPPIRPEWDLYQPAEPGFRARGKRGQAPSGGLLCRRAWLLPLDGDERPSEYNNIRGYLTCKGCNRQPRRLQVGRSASRSQRPIRARTHYGVTCNSARSPQEEWRGQPIMLLRTSVPALRHW